MSGLTPVAPATPSGPENLIPDACVGVKWYVPESDSQAAARLLDPRFALHVPDDFFTEAASVLQRKVAVEGTLSVSEALDVYRLLRTVPMTVHAPQTTILPLQSLHSVGQGIEQGCVHNDFR